MAISTVFPTQVADFLTENAGLRDEPIFWVLVFSAIILWALAVVFAESRAKRNVDDVRQWSVSVDPGMPAVQVRGAQVSRFLVQMCHFANLSSVQSREIEMTILLPYFDKRKEPVKLWATRDGELESLEGWASVRDRFAKDLRFPIKIPPNETVEGFVEFDVPGGIVETDLDWTHPIVHVSERRSALTMALKPLHVYDASRGKQYRGSIGAPFPLRRAVLKRLAMRLWK